MRILVVDVNTLFELRKLSDFDPSPKTNELLLENEMGRLGEIRIVVDYEMNEKPEAIN